MKPINAILRKLNFDDLQDWAGETILNRGKGYVKRVDQLSRTQENTLVAWVTGSEQYATSVRVDADGDIDDFCTCPYSWGPCKHAVAVILAAAELVKKKQTIPPLEKDSDLGQTLFGDPEEDEWIDDEWEEINGPIYPPTTKRTKAQAKLGKILADKTRRTAEPVNRSERPVPERQAAHQ